MDIAKVINKTITVKAPPSANDFVVEGALGGKVGDSVTLELTFHANPEPKQIKWYMHDLETYLMVPDLADIGIFKKLSTKKKLWKHI